ncbi:MAG TPA: transcription antitermination factor NusB [Vicinamibacteria bacterium]|nr:transcription antitermination factor NusB [Vicinamibacteria bacterium]
MATPARRLALRILLDCERGSTTVGDLLAAPQVSALPPRDRAFLQELVLGSLRRRGQLDFALGPLLSRPLPETDAGVRAALRLGAYEILQLRVPDRAAVSEAVELAREVHPPAAGFVNAVLRRLAREGPPAAPDPVLDPLGWLTTQGSLPRWLAERWLGRLGPGAAVARAQAMLAPPPAAFRLNPQVPDALERVVRAGLIPEPLPVPGALLVRSGAGTAAVLAGEGVLYLQDMGAQLVAHLAAVPGLVLDACAAPGGKATLIADLLGDAGRVVAAEASPRRLRTLAALVARWGSTNLRLVAADAARPPFGCRFDAVLLDAPCSGLGTLTRNPDIKWRLHQEALSRQAGRQRRLLETLAPCVGSGGRLIYATCSPEREENEDVVSEFLARHPDFAPSEPPAWTAPYRDGPFLRTTPEGHGCDAFFAAILAR